MEAACDIFHSIYGNGRRSDIIQDLLQQLNFHTLSIALHATVAFNNMWDYNLLVREWYARRAKVLRTDYNESLTATIELLLASPTFRGLGPSARDLLGVVAFFPKASSGKTSIGCFPQFLIEQTSSTSSAPSP